MQSSNGIIYMHHKCKMTKINYKRKSKEQQKIGKFELQKVHILADPKFHFLCSLDKQKAGETQQINQSRNSPKQMHPVRSNRD